MLSTVGNILVHDINDLKKEDYLNDQNIIF